MQEERDPEPDEGRKRDRQGGEVKRIGERLDDRGIFEHEAVIIETREPASHADPHILKAQIADIEERNDAERDDQDDRRRVEGP